MGHGLSECGTSSGMCVCSFVSNKIGLRVGGLGLCYPPGTNGGHVD